MNIKSDSNIKFAGFWIRAAGYIIDHAILGLVTVPAQLIAINTGDPIIFIFYLVFVMIVFWLYEALMHSSNLQATLGKIVIGTIVVDRNGKRISFAKATGRHFAEYLSSLLFGIGYMMAGWKKEKTALHDILAETYVVYKKPNMAFEKTKKIQPMSFQKTKKMPSTFRFPYDLQVLNGPESGKVIPLIGHKIQNGYFSLTLGRGEFFDSNHIKVIDPDYYISQKHAEFAYNDNLCYVRNLSETNPINHNGIPLYDTNVFQPIRSGETLTMGLINFKITPAT